MGPPRLRPGGGGVAGALDRPLSQAGPATPSGAYVGLRSVAAHHPLTVEYRADLGDRLLHHPDPVRAVPIVERQHGIAELLIEVRSVGGSDTPVGPNGPPGHAFVPTLEPPSVERAEVQHAVEGGLHAAGPGGFE